MRPRTFIDQIRTAPNTQWADFVTSTFPSDKATAPALLIDTSTPDWIMRLPEVIKVTGLSRSSIWNRLNHPRYLDPTFPKPRPLSNSPSGRAIGWSAQEIFAWINM